MPVSYSAKDQFRLETLIRAILMDAGVKPQDTDRALKWAFGPDAWDIPPREWPDRWNRLHPQAFHATGRDGFKKFLYVVGFYYVQQKQRHEMQTDGSS